jgi:hypothetical protein
MRLASGIVILSMGLLTAGSPVVGDAAPTAGTPSVTPVSTKVPSSKRPIRRIVRRTVRVPVATPTPSPTATFDGTAVGEPTPQETASSTATAGSAVVAPPVPGASRWFVQASSGYVWVKARQLEEAVLMHLRQNQEVFEDNLEVLGSSGGAVLSVHNSGGGSCVVVEGGYRLGPGWGTGLRIGSSRGPAVSGSCSGRGSRGERLDVRWDFDYRMTWLSTGVWMEGGRRWKARGGLSAGLGWGRLSGGWTMAYDFKTPPSVLPAYAGSLHDEARGKGLILEFGGDVSHPLNDEGLSAFVSGSYRVAKGSLLEAVETGDPELDSYLAHLEVDFGGIAVLGGLRLDL